MRSGFQVVDCPPFTATGKNGADIQMVMDILDALEHKTSFDEFILLSGDSDFTPVLLRLRAHDRRTMILTAGLSAAAYRAACDVILTEEMFVEHALRIQRSSQRLESGSLCRKAADFIRELVENSDSPIVSARVAQMLIGEFGEELKGSQWDGA